MSESTIQAAIQRNLERAGWLVVKIIQTTKNGWPDLQAVRHGETVYIEVKDVGEEPSPLQEVRHRDLRKAGARVFWTDDKNFTIL
jgi:Holliday junction resolvase